MLCLLHYGIIWCVPVSPTDLGIACREGLNLKNFLLLNIWHSTWQKVGTPRIFSNWIIIQRHQSLSGNVSVNLYEKSFIGNNMTSKKKKKIPLKDSWYVGIFGKDSNNFCDIGRAPDLYYDSLYKKLNCSMTTNAEEVSEHWRETVKWSVHLQ